MKTLEKRISENLTTKSGEIKKKYELAIELIKNPKIRVRPTRWTRSGRYISLSDKSGNVTEALDILGIDYTTGNDAPNGGKNGNYIELTVKGRRQVSFYNKNRI